MSNEKLTFSEFIDKEFSDVDMYCGINKLSHYDISKISWNFAEAQEKREYELLEEEHGELLANFCKVDMERIKLSREVEELKIKFSEATKTYTDEIDELEKKIEELEQRDINRLFHKAMTEVADLRKKLGEAIDVIEFYADDNSMPCLAFAVTGEPYGFFKHNDFEQLAEWRHKTSGKRARAFLKGNKDERS